MRHIFIINPAAGKNDVSVRIKAEIEAACAKHRIKPLIFISEYHNYEKEMTEKMCSLFSNEMIRFYSVGGSGTLTNIVSGIKDFETTEVACYPCGLTNDLLKCFGNAEEFRSIEKLICGRTERIDTLRSDMMEMVDFTLLGLGSTYWNDVTFFQLLSHITPLLPYGINVLWDIITNKSYSYEITIDGRDYSGRYIMIVCFNGNCMGGNISPIRHPRPNDGYMDIVLMDDMKLWDELRLLVPFSKGQLNKLGSHALVVRAKKIEIARFDKSRIMLNCDGECSIVPKKHCRIEVEPSKLKFIVPQNSYILPIEEQQAVNQA